MDLHKLCSSPYVLDVIDEENCAEVTKKVSVLSTVVDIRRCFYSEGDRSLK